MIAFKRNFFSVFVPLTFVCVLSACGESTKEQLGLGRQVPDEFLVVKRAPLTLPPDYSLRPPAPGAVRPQEKRSDVMARETLLGESRFQKEKDGSFEQDEMSFLKELGVDNASPDIRDIVNREAAQSQVREKPVAERLLGISLGTSKPAGVAVDAPAEARRIQENIIKGQDITEGETPALEEGD